MTSRQKTLYSDSEVVSLDQAIADFVNVTHRGLDCKSADMLTAVLDHLENIPCSNLNEKQKAYLTRDRLKPRPLNYAQHQ